MFVIIRHEVDRNRSGDVKGLITCPANKVIKRTVVATYHEGGYVHVKDNVGEVWKVRPFDGTVGGFQTIS